MDDEPLITRALTHVGHVREHNEDAILDLRRAGLWVVADGMGGHCLGDRASQTVIQALRELATLHAGAGPALVHQLPEAIQRVNRDLLDQAAVHAPGEVIGTTLAAMILEADNVHCFWAGDSRIYLLRDGVLRCMTRDHAVPESSSVPSGKQAALTRAIGADEYLELDEMHDHLYEGDVFLLCTDGLTKVLGDAEIADMLRTHTAESACQSLIDTALQGGGPDNVSCITVFVNS
ncbi:MAG: protein phosphatase 2C domain-containing protein [Aquisalimonadaceae bacterium]